MCVSQGTLRYYITAHFQNNTIIQKLSYHKFQNFEKSLVYHAITFCLFRLMIKAAACLPAGKDQGKPGHSARFVLPAHLRM